MGYLLVFGAISMLIVLHEAGHLVAAKWAGIPVARFSVGFGRRLWSFNVGDTEYRLSLIPCGGYVLPAVTDEHAFQLLPLNKRVLFALGGPLANILGAVLCFATIDVASHGFSLDTAVLAPLRETWRTVVQICSIVPTLFSQPDQLSGLVGIVAFGGKHVGMSAHRLLQLCFILNVNLAVLNLLPILPLDGGKIVMATMQRVFAPLRRLEIPLTVAGWAALVGLMLYATALDISRMAQGAVA